MHIEKKQGNFLKFESNEVKTGGKTEIQSEREERGL